MKFKLEDLEEAIPIDTSVEDWIREIEENVNKNKKKRTVCEKTKEGIAVHLGHSELKFMKEILKIKEFGEMRCSF